MWWCDCEVACWYGSDRRRFDSVGVVWVGSDFPFEVMLTMVRCCGCNARRILWYGGCGDFHGGNFVWWV